MLVRVITGIIGIPILVFLILCGGLILKISLLLVSLIGMYEFYRAVSKKINQVHFVGFIFAVAYILFIDKKIEYSLVMSGAVVFSLLILVIFHPKINIIDCAVTVFGFFYVCVLMADIYLVRASNPYGIYSVWMIFICAWFSDTGAYFAGITMGKHKLAPELSPNKTIEGAIGGILLTGLMSAVYGAVIYKFFDTVDSVRFIIVFTFIGLAGSAFAQLGDLAASSIKRYTNIKDYGRVVIGHGGVLDRFDSVLFTAPAVYFLMNML